MTGSWGGFLLATAAALAWGFGPGTALLATAGRRGLALLAPAVPASLGILAGTALLAPLLGLTWGPLLPLGATAVLVAAVLGLRRLGVLTRPATGTGSLRARAARGVPLAAVVAGGTAIVAVPVLLAMDRPDTILQRWDWLYHLSALRYAAESGTVSSLDLGAVSYSALDPAPYPAGVHALASLTVRDAVGATLPVALHATLLVLCTVAYLLGSAHLSRTLLPGVRHAAVLGAAVAGLTTVSPAGFWLHNGALPNVAAAAVLPAALALLVAWTRRVRVWRRIPRDGFTEPILLVPVLLGLVLTHPAVAANWYLVAVCAAAWALAPHVRSLRSSGRPARRVAAALLAVAPPLALLALALVGLLPGAAGIVSFPGGDGEHALIGVGRLLVGFFPALWSPTATAMTIAAWIAAFHVVRAALRNRRARLDAGRAPRRGGASPLVWWVAATLLSAAIYYDSSVHTPWNLSGLWYSDQGRMGLTMATVLTPLAVLALDAARRRFAAGASARSADRHRGNLRARTRAGAGLAAAIAVVTFALDASVALDAERTDVPRFLTAAERSVLDRAAADGTLPTGPEDGTVLGSPLSGTAHLYGLYGTDVAIRVAGQTLYPELQTEIERLARVSSPEQACTILRGVGADWLYQDAETFRHHARYDLLDEAMLSDAPVVLVADTAVLRNLAGCAE